MESEKLQGSLTTIFGTLLFEIDGEFFKKLQPDETEKKPFLMQDFKERKPRRAKTDFTSVKDTHNSLLIKHDLENLIKEKDLKMNSINDKIWFGPKRTDFVPKTIDQIQKLFLEDLEDLEKSWAVYYRSETQRKADTTFYSYTTKGILHFPKEGKFYKLDFEAHYDKRTYTYFSMDDKKDPNLNPTGMISWKRVFPKDFLYSLKAHQISPLREAIFAYAERKKIFIDHNELV
jgi:hypothetical protein